MIDIRDIKSQVEDRMGENDDARLAEMGGGVNEQLSGVEVEIYQVRNQSNQDPLNYPIMLNNKIAALLNHVDGSENRPTEQSYQVFEVLSEELETQLNELDRVILTEVAALNELLDELGLEPIQVTRVPIA